MIGWLQKAFSDRRARKLVPVVIQLLAGDRSLRSLAMENQDAAFEKAVRWAARNAGLKLTDEQVTEVRLSVATVLLQAVHAQLIAEQKRKER